LITGPPACVESRPAPHYRARTIASEIEIVISVYRGNFLIAKGLHSAPIEVLTEFESRVTAPS
jgi:hypothetical protein